MIDWASLHPLSRGQKDTIRQAFSGRRMDTWAIAKLMRVREAEVEREIHRLLDERIANRQKIS